MEIKAAVRGPLFKFVAVFLFKTVRVNTYIAYIFGKIELLSKMQAKNNSKRITSTTSKRQRYTYIMDTGNALEI